MSLDCGNCHKIEACEGEGECARSRADRRRLEEFFMLPQNTLVPVSPGSNFLYKQLQPRLDEAFMFPASAQLGRCTIHSLRIGNESGEPERCPWDDWKPGRDVS